MYRSHKFLHRIFRPPAKDAPAGVFPPPVPILNFVKIVPIFHWREKRRTPHPPEPPPSVQFEKWGHFPKIFSMVTLNIKVVPDEKIKKFLMEKYQIPDYQADVCVAFAQEMWEKQSSLRPLMILMR